VALVTFGGLPLLAYMLGSIACTLSNPIAVARVAFVYMAVLLPASATPISTTFATPPPHLSRPNHASRPSIRKWRLKCRAVADSLEEAGDRMFT
jgi:hypothetical protein